ncbi:MAG TPA: hypothetical protein VFS62_12205 [Chloroflexota bacterium]|nr:hypothetical protein [Chloroflexota bacterium]
MTVGFGLIFLLGAAVASSLHAPAILVVYLAIGGGLLVVSIAIERSTYRPKVDSSRGTWQMTGERFRDPASGRMMEVRFNPATGQRDYVQVD